MTGEALEPVALPAVPTGPAGGLVNALHAALMELSARLPDLVGRPDAQVRAWRELGTLRESLGVVVRELESMLVAECPQRVNRNGRTVRDRLVLEDIGVVVEPTGTSKDWKDVEWSRLLSAVFDRAGVRALVDGEVVDGSRVAEIVLDVIGGGYMKSNKANGTGLARYGLAREQFARFVEGTHVGVKVVGIPRNDGAPMALPEGE